MNNEGRGENCTFIKAYNMKCVNSKHEVVKRVSVHVCVFVHCGLFIIYESVCKVHLLFQYKYYACVRNCPQKQPNITWKMGG